MPTLRLPLLESSKVQVELVPPPFNLLRRTMLLCYSVLASFTTLARSLYVVATERDEAVGGAALPATSAWQTIPLVRRQL